MNAPDYVVMYSGGKGSWAAAMALPAEADVVLLFTDTNGEDPDLYRFLHETAEQLDRPLIVLNNDGATIWDVFRKARMIGNTRISVCSRVLKQAPARKWLEEHADPTVTKVVVGIDWTESHRLPAIERNYAPYGVVAPLTEPGAWSKDRIDAELAALGIAQPALYAQGFPHNNCAGACVRGGQGQWALLLEKNRERYLAEEAQENAFRDELGKDVAILRDRGRTTRLAAVGLTDADVETYVEYEDEDGYAVTSLVHRETQTVIDLPSLVPLTLTALRHRIEGEEPGEVDMDDIGGCGCMTDLAMDLDEVTA